MHNQRTWVGLTLPCGRWHSVCTGTNSDDIAAALGGLCEVQTAVFLVKNNICRLEERTTE